MIRTGFCCFILKSDGSRMEGTEFKSTTQKFLKSRSFAEQASKIGGIVAHNLKSLSNSIHYVSMLPEEQRMFRIGSDLFGFYEHPEFKVHYEPLMPFITSELKKIGDSARAANIRLSMHPDQYCVINSETQEVVDKSLLFLEYHADVARMMGYGVTKQDFKINIHLSGRSNIIPYDRMSDTVKNTLTFENDERTGTLERVLGICEKYDIPCVLDIHHHWCNTGDYLFEGDELIERVKRTWVGTNMRPVLHVSHSREEVWPDKVEAPCMTDILKNITRKETFKHSDMIDNEAFIEYLACTFRSDFDFQVEAKLKSIASAALVKKLKLYEV